MHLMQQPGNGAGAHREEGCEADVDVGNDEEKQPFRELPPEADKARQTLIPG